MQRHRIQGNSKEIVADKTYERINVTPLNTMRKSRMIDAMAQNILWYLGGKVAVQREFSVDVGKVLHSMYTARDVRAT